jgi:hypothetical protein
MSGKGSTFSRWIFPAVLSVLAALYLLQTASPLRLDNDAVDYLSRAAALADGRELPLVWVLPGFPAMIAILDHAGLGSSFYFILLNCLFMALGLLAAWHILADYPPAVRRWTLALTLLSVPMVRNVSLPIPEAVFFGLSLLALWAATASTRAASGKRLGLWTAAVILTAIASSVRVAGLTLIPALIWSCLAPLRRSDTGDRNRGRLRTAALLMLVPLLALAIALSRTDAFAVYLNQAEAAYSAGGVWAALLDRVVGLFVGLGELVVNLPFSRFKSLKLVFFVVGVISALALIYARPLPRRLSPPAIYLATYLFMLACWPHDSPRLWMPILPLLIAVVVATLIASMPARPAKLFVQVYVAWFVLTGLLALAYTTRITFSKSEFFSVYGNNGGLASPGAPGRRPNPLDVRRYNEAAREVLMRYGGHQIEPPE